MTELYIDGQLAVLPEDFSFTLTEENAQITNRGEWTLDNYLELTHPVNAKIFKHLNRLNVNNIILTMSAVFIIENKPKYGKIVILKNSDTRVDYQFVAGNSELNTDLLSDDKIWSLNWDVESAITTARALYSMAHPGYDNGNFTCTPIKVGTTLVNDYDSNLITTDIPPAYPDKVANIIMQPYLLYYINKLPVLLGYTLKSNVLNSDSRAKKMYMTNAIQSLNYSDCLPDWTISEFITNVEAFFNVSFLVDSKDKSVSIVGVLNDIESKKVVKLTQVIDSYERDMTVIPEVTRLDPTKISYDIGDSGIFKYQKLSDDLVEKCATPTLLDFILSGTYVKGDFNLFTGTGNQYMYSDAPTISLYYLQTGMTAPYKNVYNVNKFRSTSTDSTRELTLKIVPAEIILEEKFWPYTSAPADAYSYQLPKSSQADIITPTSQSFLETIESAVTLARPDKIEVALFTGYLRLNWWRHDFTFGVEKVAYFPFSHVDHVPEFTFDGASDNWDDWQTFLTAFEAVAADSLVFEGDGNMIDDYYASDLVDLSKLYLLKFLDNKDIDVNNLFEYNNKKYIPVLFEKVVIPIGYDEVISGKFYALK